jgi:DNA-binding MarR family transcriptional regulator
VGDSQRLHEGSRPDRDAGADALLEGLNSADLAVNRAVVRWLLDADLPFLSACVFLTLDPPDTPVGAREVADEIGISVEDATLALHELRSLGYAREEGRRYEPTEEGLEVHASLMQVRRDALGSAIASLSAAERQRLGQALTGGRAS